MITNTSFLLTVSLRAVICLLPAFHKHTLNVWLLMLVFVIQGLNIHEDNHRAPLSRLNSSDLSMYFSCPHPGLFITWNCSTSKILNPYMSLSGYIFFPLRAFILLSSFLLLFYFWYPVFSWLISLLQPNFLPWLAWALQFIISIAVFSILLTYHILPDTTENSVSCFRKVLSATQQFFQEYLASFISHCFLYPQRSRSINHCYYFWIVLLFPL